MKRDKWDKTAWTAFQECAVAHIPEKYRPHAMFRNSIYQVSVWYGKHPVYGEFAHLSFKTHDKAPRHDWREMQRIKNELCGEECWAVEMFPPEDQLVDTSNQYHLWVFRTFKFGDGLGFTDGRLVTEGSYDGAVQRSFRPELKPPDLVPKEEMRERIKNYKDPDMDPVIKGK